MDFSRINIHDMLQFESEYPQAYNFLLARTLRNEWMSYAGKLYSGKALNTYETARFKGLTKAEVYDVEDIPMLNEVQKYVV